MRGFLFKALAEIFICQSIAPRRSRVAIDKKITKVCIHN